MRVCDRCKKPIEAKKNIVIDDCVTVPDTIYLCDECLFKLVTFLSTTDYEYVKKILTRVGYEKDIDPHDDEHYFILSAYGNKVAVEFNDSGEFEKITEAE